MFNSSFAQLGQPQPEDPFLAKQEEGPRQPNF